MTLCVAGDIGRLHVTNIPFVHVARRDVASRHQVAQPRCHEWIALIVVGATHWYGRRTRGPVPITIAPGGGGPSRVGLR